MPSIITKAEDYLSRVRQGFYTELGEGDRLLKEVLEHLKTFIIEEPTSEVSSAPAGEPTPTEEAPEYPSAPEEATEGTEAAPGEMPTEAHEEITPTQEIPAEAGPAPETTSAPDEAPKA